MEMLSSKIRINTCYKSAPLPNGYVSFYRKYASFVAKALSKPLFQSFLSWLLKRENIDKNSIQDIQVWVFPFHKENGNSLAGKIINKCKILIFPKSAKFYRKLVTQHGSEIAHSYVKSRACATLIHEILHSKYSSDEERVRELTERYFNIYARSEKTEDLESVVFEILFKQQ
jgi:hypothetical protein